MYYLYFVTQSIYLMNISIKVRWGCWSVNVPITNKIKDRDANVIITLTMNVLINPQNNVG